MEASLTSLEMCSQLLIRYYFCSDFWIHIFESLLSNLEKRTIEIQLVAISVNLNNYWLNYIARKFSVTFYLGLHSDNLRN